jgi:hypothetical protein
MKAAKIPKQIALKRDPTRVGPPLRHIPEKFRAKDDQFGRRHTKPNKTSPDQGERMLELHDRAA